MGETPRVMRGIDLAPYNVFDIDGFGAPWEALLILAARRRWAPGEAGAVVLTDGASITTRLGGCPVGLAELLGIGRLQGLAPGASSFLALHKMGARAWARRAGVRVTRQWVAESKTSGKGSYGMAYSALVFEGARGNCSLLERPDTG